MKTIYKKLFIFLLFLPFSVLAQGTLTGTVTEKSTGQPLPGVNVVVQGTTNGTSTDFDGKYSLNNVKKGDKIVFSYIGFKDLIMDYNSQATLSVSMEEDANQLQEVVVQVGYGTVKKKDASTAVTTVTAKDFQKGPVVAAEQLIQGRVAGVQVTNGGGAPGEGSIVRIRSGSSINGNNDPLYIIDGVAVDAGGGGVQGGRSPLANINQNDIASMTILKDAAATAIYGSRASNGVIIITTKRGKSGEMKVEYNGNFQVSEVSEYVNVMGANQFRDFVNQYGNPTQISLLGASNTDWQKEIFRTAYGTDHNISLGGGKDNITYRASLGYTNMNGILKHDNFERSTLGLSLIGNFFDNHLRVEVNNKSAVIHNNYSNRDAIGAAVSFDPTQTILSGNDNFGGYFQWLNTGGTFESNANRNPVSMLEQKHNFGNQFRSIGNAQLEYKIHGFEALKLVANVGYDYASGRGYGSTDADYIVTGEAGDTYDSRQENKNILMDLYFNYNKNFEAIDSNLDFTAGYNYQDFRYSQYYTNFDAASSVTNITSNIGERLNLQSFFGRASFTIAEKYILNGSIRADGSSRFTEDNRWGYFPAASAAWRVSNENFLKESKYVSEFKLRASWGITGQQDTGSRYPSYPLYLQSFAGAAYQLGYDASGNPVFVETFSPQAYNSDLKWEETETINVGADFGFFNNRITGEVSAYRRRTKDLLLFAQNPQGVNFTNYAFYNIGSLENKGVEVALDLYPVRNEKVSWRVGGNVTFQTSEITSLSNSPVPSFDGYDLTTVAGGTGTFIQNHQVGYAPASFYVFEQAYDVDGSPIYNQFVDRNGDGIVNSDDKYRFHKPAADVYFGFNTDVTFGNWWFSSSFRGATGNYVYDNVNSQRGNLSVLPGNGNYLVNATPEAATTNFPQPQYQSDFYIKDASYVKWDNVTLGYTFKDVFDKGSTMRLTGAVQNVLLITGYKGIDPEVQNGVDNNLYPRPRTYTLGLNINF
ncbi:MAG: TonB-dependent receptor [Flavobacterium sp.]|uniref:SusC/RagA family TonB-linked outer membrane protein n=1 Tax=Flavobacterium sp. TaxID=239 RepID=UPI001229564B|nr:TonB-dependent receptor [Flavobacterium sp.]RZJ66730.1 MAG: TonB-dependent receptor [Flavobacterium sp.]